MTPASPRKHDEKEMVNADRPVSCCPCYGRTLESVATSWAVPTKVLLTLRAGFLLAMVVGGIWLIWESHDRPRCLPDWAYVAGCLYFAMAIVGCLRYTHAARAAGGEEPANRSLGSSTTLLLLEIAVVFQTLAVIVTWIEYAQGNEGVARAVVASVGLSTVLVDLALGKCSVKAKHVWISLVFLLAWAVQQVAWVSADADHEACYGVFDARGPGSVISAAVAALVVVALSFAYAALCCQRDGLMSRFGLGPDPAYPEGADDVEEDLGEDAAVTRSMSLPTLTLRPLPASERASVVNPIFAGRGSRMKRNGWASGNGAAATGEGCGGTGGSGDGAGGSAGERRTSLASIETEMSSGEDIENGWQVYGENSGGGGGGSGGHHAGGAGCGGHRAGGNSGSGSKHARVSPAEAPDGAGRRADSGRGAHNGGGKGLPSHSSWADYGGGGAAAWVRSGRDPAPSAQRGGKVGHRRSNSRY